ncbi:MAG: hypothetical protein Q8R16_04520, partial [bacterium]|nr:hypothetical protein [bacterium]
MSGMASQIIEALKQDQKLSDAAASELTAAAAGGQDVERLLLERKLLSEDELLRLRGRLLGLPVVSLMGREIPPAILTTIPRNLAERYQVIAFEREGNRITVGLT